MADTQNHDWQNSNLQVFWGEIAPCDHVVQIYENDTVFLNSLEGFIGSGFIAGDAVIIVATADHLIALEKRLKNQGFDLDSLSSSDQYIAVEAHEMLSKFMEDRWPNEKLFCELLTTLLKRAKRNNRKVRAFGEMVAILWQQGFTGATIQLEHLWNKLLENENFTLFCSYPKIGFTQNINSSIELICSTHAKVIKGEPELSTEVYYRTPGFRTDNNISAAKRI